MSRTSYTLAVLRESTTSTRVERGPHSHGRPGTVKLLVLEDGEGVDVDVDVVRDVDGDIETTLPGSPNEEEEEVGFWEELEEVVDAESKGAVEEEDDDLFVAVVTNCPNFAITSSGWAIFLAVTKGSGTVPREESTEMPTIDSERALGME